MVIDFKELEGKKLDSFKGGDKYLLLKKYEDGDYKIMQSVLPPKASIGYHTHQEDCEIILVLGGEGVATFNGQKEILKKGSCHYCPKGSSHGIENLSEEDFVMFAIVPKNNE